VKLPLSAFSDNSYVTALREYEREILFYVSDENNVSEI